MRTAARLPIRIGQNGDGFLIERRFDDEVSRFVLCLTNLGFSVRVSCLRLYIVSFGFVSHFTTFKPNTAML